MGKLRMVYSKIYNNVVQLCTTFSSKIVIVVTTEASEYSEIENQ